MQNPIRFIASLMLGLVVASGGLAQEKREPLLVPSTADRATLVDDVIRQLSLRFDIPKPIDTTLQEVIEGLHERLGVNFQLIPEAFNSIDPPLPEVEKTRIKIPQTKNIRLDQFLEQFLKPLGGTVMVRPRHLEITTTKEAWREAAGGPAWVEPQFNLEEECLTPPAPEPAPRGPIVHALLGDRRFLEVVQDMADQFGDRNIIVAPQVGSKVRTMLSGRLINVPLQDALETIAELADLKCVSMNNIYLITTKERAGPIEREFNERRDIQQIQSYLASRGILSTPTQIRRAYLQPQPTLHDPRRPPRPSWEEYSQRVQGGNAGR